MTALLSDDARCPMTALLPDHFRCPSTDKS